VCATEISRFCDHFNVNKVHQVSLIILSPSPILEYDTRDEKLPAQTMEVPAHFNFHYANAFEDKQGNIIMGKRHRTTPPWMCLLTRTNNTIIVLTDLEVSDLTSHSFYLSTNCSPSNPLSYPNILYPRSFCPGSFTVVSIPLIIRL
jgi:Retinal pigment epithelial membrane protein